MIKFKDIEWNKRQFWGEVFGFHGKAHAYLPTGEVIHFTADTEVMNFNFTIGGWMRRFKGEYGVLLDNDGNEYPLHGFVTKDGKEPAKRNPRHWIGRERAGIPMVEDLFLAVRGRGKVKVTYSGARLVK